MAEPEPETNNDPEVPGGNDEVGSDRNMEVLGNHTLHPEPEPDPEPQYNFASTFGIWWDIHRYGLGVVFFLIAIYAFRSSTKMLCRKQGRKATAKPFLVFINVLVVIMCLLRAVYLFVNPYNQVGFFPVVVNNILFNIPFPCMTACFAMILWVLREVSQVKLSVRSRSRSLRALCIIAVTHLGSVVIISAIIEFTGNKIMLIVMCHGFFVIWELFLCFSAALLMCRISKAVRETGKMLVRISTMANGHSTQLQSDVNVDTNKNKLANESKQNTKGKSPSIQICFGTKNNDKIKLCDSSTSEIQTIDQSYNDVGEVDVQIVETPSKEHLDDLNPYLLNVKSTLGKTTADNSLSDESHNSLGSQRAGSSKSTEFTSPGSDIQAKMLAVIFTCTRLSRDTDNPDDKMMIEDTDKLSTVSSVPAIDLDHDDRSSHSDHSQERNSSLNSKLQGNGIPKESGDKMSSDHTQSKLAKLKVSTSPTIRKLSGTSSGHPVHPTFPDMDKRARLTQKVTRITIVTTVTSCIACILNLFFILSLFPCTDIFQDSQYSIFIFWTCFRVTEIAMACVILYFVAQPMPKSRTRTRPTINRS